MIYLSQLIDQKVWDAFGHVVGKIDDIMVNATEKSVPPLSALVLKGAPENKNLIDAQSIASLWPSVTLKTDISKLIPYTPKGHELLLKQRVLDQQIVDTEGKRLVRVNDLQIARKGDQFFLTGVDASFNGLLRRLGLENIGKSIARTFKKEAPFTGLASMASTMGCASITMPAPPPKGSSSVFLCFRSE